MNKFDVKICGDGVIATEKRFEKNKTKTLEDIC